MSLRRLELHTTVCSRDREWPSVVPSVDGGSPTGVAAMEIVQQLIQFTFYTFLLLLLMMIWCLRAHQQQSYIAPILHTPFC